ncbi:MAG: hypothetical protein WAQ77_14680 [Candidatus Acidiferrum sp.]
MQTQIGVRMIFCVCRDLRQPGTWHHDAGGRDRVLIQCIEASCVHGMRNGKIIGVHDEEFRIRGVAQALRDGLRLCCCARGRDEH